MQASLPDLVQPLVLRGLPPHRQLQRTDQRGPVPGQHPQRQHQRQQHEGADLSLGSRGRLLHIAGSFILPTEKFTGLLLLNATQAYLQPSPSALMKGMKWHGIAES